MKIGELAKRTRVSVQTIRFYERSGLIPEPPRTSGGYRAYDIEDLERIRVIRVCQKLGFTLDDVRSVLDPHRLLTSTGVDNSRKERARLAMLATARKRLVGLGQKLAALQFAKVGMEALVTALTANEMRSCPAASLRHER